MILLILAAVLFSGCVARSNARVSEITPPAVLTTALTADGSVERDWWSQFNDPVLDGLMADALSANRDIHAAVARVVAARELAGVARLAQLPTGGAVAGAARQHLSEREAGGLDLPSRTGSLVHAGVELAWEADVFGRLRARTSAAVAEAAAAA